ncbi:MAG TPA: Asp-tRNA(Asn)/Glu-tRNA(Gln) amidotransferase subunit GatA [Patescibacteria group bacterium]
MEIPVSIKEVQAGLLNKKFDATQLVNSYLERIKKYDKEINSFLTVTEERAFSDAKKVDEEISNKAEKAFSEKPLLGAVVALKDLYLTKGIRTTAASKVLTDYIPAYSSTVVKRLEEAGAILIGKTNCDAWAHGASGENSDFGPTKNPWNKACVPGGSSSGSAASIASSFATFAMGTDTGGSIRQPSSFCNLVGLKPTYGAVSRYGVVAMASSLDSMGCLTSTVTDARKIFNVIKGRDEFDGTVKDFPKSNSGKKKIRIGIPKEYFTEGLDREVEKLALEASHVLKKNGVELVDVTLPHTKYAVAVYYIVQPAEVSSNLGRYDGVRFGNDREAFGDEAKRRIMLGTYVLSSGYYDAYYLKAMKVRSKIIEDFEKAFEKVDVILSPVSPTPAFKIGEKANDPLKMYLADIYTVAANLAGIPGLSIPGGFTKNGLPVGFQLLGPRFSEDTLFDLGEKYQEETDWHLKRPNLEK